MSLTCFACGCNVITVKKERVYAMTCAWAQMVDYDKVTMLIGSQSDTNKVLCVGDIVGVSALSNEQEDISNYIGTTHSTKVDKLKDIKTSLINNAIVIENAKVQMECEIINIIKLNNNEDDKLVYMKVLNYKENDKKQFLIFKK